MAADVLARQGVSDLASRYRARSDAMAQNAVRLFYEPMARKVRSEVKIIRAGGGPVYINNLGGQYLDLEAEGRVVDGAGLEAIHRAKTAALFGAACALGALAGGGDPDQVETLDQYGTYLGLAFQIVDDLLDETGDAARMGKAVGMDRRLAKATYPSVYGLEAARGLAERVAGEARAGLAGLDGEPSLLEAFVDLVLEIEGAGISERTRRYLSHVKEASAHAGLLVDALLDFSRMGRSALKCTWINTDVLVDDLVAEQAGAPRDGRVEWDVQHPLPRLWADPVLIQVALRNLISNAVKYSRTREVARIEIAPVQDARGVGLAVSDNGVGFQMKYVDKLFGVFQRLHRSEAFEGTGIGLASVRRIVERHGGSVQAWGELDRGARFTFVLPLPEDSE